MSANPRVDRVDIEGVRIIRFRDRRLFDEATVREATDQVFAALPREREAAPVRLVLDFTGVEQVSSSMLGKLVLIQRKVEGTGGRFRLCELSPAVLAVLRTTNLDRLFPIDRDRRAAIEAIAG